MSSTIGQTIKKLRKERNLTQEELAEQLNVTFQAVSKWENETGLPDISQVVPLASVFGVSIDTLFSYNEQANDERTREFEKRYDEYSHYGEYLKCAEVMREALALYPNNYHFIMNLATALYLAYCANGEKNDFKDEIIALCERVLKDCIDDSTRHSAIQLLCYVYPKIGKRDRAIELANKMPNMCLCSGMLLAHIYEGEKRVKQVQRNIMEHIDWAAMDLHSSVPIGDFTTEKRVLCVETAIKLYELIYYDGNMNFYHCRLAQYYHSLARLYMEKDTKKAMECLLLAEKNASAFDDVAEKDVPYTSVFVNKQTHSPSGTSKNWVGTERGLLLGRLDEECFAPLRGMPEFVALKERVGK